MFGCYTTLNYSTTNGRRNQSVYDITNGNANLVYFNSDRLTDTDNEFEVSMLDDNTAYIHSVHGFTTRDYSVIFDFDDGTYRTAGGNVDRIAFYNNDDFYTFSTWDGLLKYGSTTSSSYTTVVKAQNMNNVLNKSLCKNNNSQGYTVYNGQPYYLGTTLGSVYTLNISGIPLTYISAIDVENGDKAISKNYLDFFSMDYDGLPMWYDSNLGVIKRYVRN